MCNSTEMRICSGRLDATGSHNFSGNNESSIRAFFLDSEYDHSVANHMTGKRKTYGQNEIICFDEECKDKNTLSLESLNIYKSKVDKIRAFSLDRKRDFHL